MPRAYQHDAEWLLSHVPRRATPPTSQKLDGKQIMLFPPELMADDEEWARRAVWRFTDRHGCTGADCAHPEHPEFAALLAERLDQLGLLDTPAPSGRDRVKGAA